MLANQIAATEIAVADVDDRLARLVSTHRDALVRTCTRQLNGDRHLAEDAVHDAFLKLRRALSSGQQIDDAGAWLRTVARNAAIDELRKRSSFVLESPPDAVFSHSFADGDPDLEVAWRGLSPRHREILRLREIDGLRYEEIASAMATRVTVIDTLLFRARAALRREYTRAAAATSATPVVVSDAVGHGWLRRLLDGATDTSRMLGVRLDILGMRVGATANAVAGVLHEAVGALAVAGALAGGASLTAPALPKIDVPAVPAIDTTALPAAPTIPEAAAPATPTATTPPTTVPTAPTVPVVPQLGDAVDGLVDTVDGLLHVPQEILSPTGRNR
ncbi:MAG: hypothetical protein V7636_485 [Actinomycetota bacterium]